MPLRPAHAISVERIGLERFKGDRMIVNRRLAMIRWARATEGVVGFGVINPFIFRPERVSFQIKARIPTCLDQFRDG